MKLKRGWRPHYPTALLYDVVVVMQQRPDLGYQQVLEWACRQHGVEYKR